MNIYIKQQTKYHTSMLKRYNKEIRESKTREEEKAKQRKSKSTGRKVTGDNT